MEYLFDTTRAVVNLIFGGAIERYPRVRFILPHAGGLVPYFAWRLSVSPMIDKRLQAAVAGAGLRRAAALLVRQRAVARRADLGLPRERRRARSDRVRHRLAVRQSARDRRDVKTHESGSPPARAAPRSTAPMRCGCFRNMDDRVRRTRHATGNQYRYAGLAIDLMSDATSPIFSTDHTCPIMSFARAGPNTGPTRSRNFAMQPGVVERHDARAERLVGLADELAARGRHRHARRAQLRIEPVDLGRRRDA